MYKEKRKKHKSLFVHEEASDSDGNESGGEETDVFEEDGDDSKGVDSQLASSRIDLSFKVCDNLITFLHYNPYSLFSLFLGIGTVQLAWKLDT